MSAAETATAEQARAWQQRGNALARDGRFEEAVASYRRSLQFQPDAAPVHNNLGIALAGLGHREEALGSLTEAVRLSPESASAHNNRGNVLEELGRLGEAAASFQEAIRLRPVYAEAHNNLGLVYQKQNRLSEAEAAFRQALRLRPDYAKAHSNLGNVLSEQGRFSEAISHHESALRLRPAEAGFRHNLGRTHKNLGITLQARENFEEAQRHLERAVEHNPGDAQAHLHLGMIFHTLEKYGEARASYERVLDLQPDHPAAHKGLGLTLVAQRNLPEALVKYQRAVQLQPDDAEAYWGLGAIFHGLWNFAGAAEAYRKAIELKPDWIEPRCNYAALLADEGRIEEALASFEHVLTSEPDMIEARFGRGFIWLKKGDYERGWAEYEWRWRRPGQEMPSRQALWAGTPLEGKPIFLWAEQGPGDTLQFIRYASLVKERCGTVIVGCQKPLLRLLSRTPGIDKLMEYKGPPLPAAYSHAPLLSLPSIVGTTLATVPAQVPYLFPDPELAARWRNEISCVTDFKIGIFWQGRPNPNPMRSAPLAAFAPLAQLPGVRLFSLQTSPGTEQLEEIASRFPVIDLGSRFDDFADTAAAMSNLDLIITIDTAVAHCAGGLGRSVWVVLPFAADWRWLLDRKDSPWYPTMSLFRQRQAGDWEEVFARVAAALKKGLSERNQSAGVREAIELEGTGAGTEESRVHHNRGRALLAEGKPAEAVESFEQALRLASGYVDAHRGAAEALHRLGNWDEAARHCEQVVEIEPGSAEGHRELGKALFEQREMDRGLACYDRALELKPHWPDVRFERAMFRLLAGDFQRGWAEMEQQWLQTRQWVFPHRRYGPYHLPRWDGSPLAGRTLLVIAEEGLGDTLHLVRYATLSKQQGCTVIVACQRQLLTLLGRCAGIDRLVDRDSVLPEADVFVPLSSLPRILGTTPATIPAQVPYILPDPALVERWGREVRSVSGFRVGIAWQGDPQISYNLRRSVPLSAFARLARVPGVRLINLQVGPGLEELIRPDPPVPVIDLGTQRHPFADTAAVIQNLDLVISVDTSPVHLAGALGVPTWVLLPRTPHWIWFFDREDSPWYPTVRLFRQERHGDWGEVFARVEAELRREAGGVKGGG